MTTPRDPARSWLGDDLDATSSAIRADIERTRERLGETVEALGAQLNPTHLKQRVKDSVREATIGRVQHMASKTRDRISESGRGLAQTIRENPVPAAMAAAGIGWLLMNSRERERPLLRRAVRRRLADEVEDFGDESDAYEGRALRADVGEFGEEVRDRARDLSERVQEGVRRVADRTEGEAATVGERVHEAKERIADRVQEARERVAERASSARHRVAERARDARRAVADRASATSRRVREASSRAAHATQDRYNESPIGMGAVALAIGLAIGYSLPATRREARVMGDARDRLVDRARERVADARERIEGTVDRAMPDVKAAVREAARDTGLSG
jgi:ElaB/YqjD/DUF883 family membrane-anchored ribosome-binding protein